MQSSKGTFWALGNTGFIWSSKEIDEKYAILSSMFDGSGRVTNGAAVKKDTGMSVRCLKD